MTLHKQVLSFLVANMVYIFLSEYSIKHKEFPFGLTTVFQRAVMKSRLKPLIETKMLSMCVFYMKIIDLPFEQLWIKVNCPADKKLKLAKF